MTLLPLYYIDDKDSILDWSNALVFRVPQYTLDTSYPATHVAWNWLSMLSHYPKRIFRTSHQALGPWPTYRAIIVLFVQMV